jgi:hypothetical protein
MGIFLCSTVLRPDVSPFYLRSANRFNAAICTSTGSIIVPGNVLCVGRTGHYLVGYTAPNWYTPNHRAGLFYVDVNTKHSESGLTHEELMAQIGVDISMCRMRAVRWN